MSWLSELFSSGDTTSTAAPAITPEQLNWFAAHGINPTTLTQQQYVVAITQANNDIAAQQKATADQAAAQKAAADKAAADAAAQKQAQADADARTKALADAETQRQQQLQQQPPQPVTPPAPPIQPEPTPPPPVQVDPVAIDPASYVPQAPTTPTPTGPTQDEINKMIQDAVTKALGDQQTQLQTQFQTQQQSDDAARAAAKVKADADAQAAADAAAATNTQRLQGLRSATGAGTDTGIRSYFQSHGVDPAQYDQQIKDAVTQALSGLSPTDENPSARVDVTGIASNLYTGDENARRTSIQNTLAQMFPDTFTNARVTSDLPNAAIDSILGTQRSSAQAIIDNMLKRGVINPTGAAAAGQDLTNQDPVARARLQSIGSGLVGGERGNINDIISRANQAASTLKLGGAFDPTAYQKEIDTSFNDFVNSLGTKVQASAPGNLYTTSGLGAVAGAAQGAGNTRFNPNALAGVLEQQTSDATRGTGKQPTSSRVTDFVF